MKPLPKKIAPFEPTEFMEAYQFAGKSTEQEGFDELMPPESILIKTSDGFKFSNHPLNRFGFATLKFFGGREDKVHAFLCRVFAFHRLFKHKKMAHYIRG